MKNGILAGYRSADGSFGIRCLYANFWSSSDADSTAWRRRLIFSNATENQQSCDRSYGFSAIYKIAGEKQ